MMSENVERVTNCVALDKMPHSAASDLGLHCFLRPSVQELKVNAVLINNNYMLNQRFDSALIFSSLPFFHFLTF